ncbi:Elongator complex protein 5 [Blyttiomyces helicus]|uniref:Elongator complex protein 5 n=1 Tax=Blyttiomyces helicus TaxID=388810 RepID=A0A4P9WR71_9FUNG|nr:Elongator complex protein 5 [Blyttiomyces helicus]|eukprot:RKO93720.1 Elongator complex protein 5 [Blyttiomyces helicus]
MALASTTHAPVLERIAAWKEASSLIVVEDSTKQSSHRLLRELADPPAPFLGPGQPLVTSADSSATPSARIKVPVVFDVFSGLFAWGAENFRASADVSEVVGQRTSACSLDDLVTKRKTVLIDSISPLLLRYPLSYIASLVKKLSALGSDTIRVIVPFHGDIPLPPSPDPRGAPELKAILAHLGTTYITVGPVKKRDQYEPTDAHDPTKGICEVLHRRRSGKIAREVVGYRSPPNATNLFRLKFTTLEDVLGVEEESLELPSSDSAPKPDPTADLSFNLRLTDEQKNARSEVVLPYIKAQAQGAIYYEPDEGDDYDDEDPDDDLDI